MKPNELKEAALDEQLAKCARDKKDEVNANQSELDQLERRKQINANPVSLTGQRRAALAGVIKS